MKLLIVAVGQRVPDWAQTAWEDYAKRFPPELKVELKAVKTEPRGSKTLETLYAAERARTARVRARGVTGQVTADYHLHANGLAAVPDSHIGVGGCYEPVGADIAGGPEHKSGDLVQNLSFIWDRAGEDHIECRNPVTGNHH